MDTYLSNPDLPIINPGYKGNLITNGQFTNAPWPDTDASFGKVFKWFLTPNPQRNEKQKDNYKPEVIPNNSLFETKENIISWLGHASFFIRTNGVNILTDPIFTDIPFVKRQIGLPFSLDDIKNIDILLISHCHRDHLDEGTLDKVFSGSPNVKVLAPLKSSGLIKKVYKNAIIQEAGWFQKYTLISGPEIIYLPALHWHRRGLNDFNQVLWGSFMISTPSEKIYFAGDTAFGSHFEEIKKVCGSPDICLLPIGAYKPSFLMNKSHTSPEEALLAFQNLGGKKFIPMHYGTYDLANEPLGEPVRKIRELVKPDELVELKVGEKFLL